MSAFQSVWTVRRWLLLGCVLTGVAAAVGSVTLSRSAHAAVTAEPTEVTALRTQTSDTVRNPDGSLTAHVYANPINYQDSSGSWQPIDSRLVPSSAQGFAFENAANSFTTRFASDVSGDYSQFTTAAGPVSMSFVGAYPASTPSVAVTAVGNGEIVYPQVESGVNLAYHLTPIGVKESVVLVDSSAPSSYSFVLKTAAQLTAKKQADGGWSFSDSSGGFAFALAPPLVTESLAPVTPPQCTQPAVGGPWTCTGAPSGPPPSVKPPTPIPGIGVEDGASAVSAAPGAGSMQVTAVAGGFRVDLAVDPSWLASAKRVFPVVIDPSVVLVGPSYDTDGTFTMNCSTCTPDVTSTHVSVGGDGTNTYAAASTFNLSSIPAGSSIGSATLNMNFDSCFPPASYSPGGNGCTWVWPWQSMIFDVHELTSPWNSSTTTSGLAIDPTVQASLPETMGYPGVGIGPGTVLSWDLTSLTQQWVSQTVVNNGLLIENSETVCGSIGGSCGITIQDSRYTPPGTPDVRPNLSITYTPALGSDASWPMWSNGPAAVNEADGNLMVTAPSPSFPTGVGTLGVPIVYNSLDPRTTGIPLGAGWSIGPQMSLTDYSALGEGDAIGVVGADRSLVPYVPMGSGSTVYQAIDGSNSILTKNGSGYTLTTGNRTVVTFGAADANGVALPTAMQQLSTATHVGELDYTFDSSGRIASMTAKGLGGTALGSLAVNWNGVNGCTVLLCITGPDGATWTYTGDSSGRLQTVNDGTRNVVKYSYDSSNRITAIQNADDLNPPYPGYNTSHQLAFAYDPTTSAVTSASEQGLSDQTPSTSTWSFGYHAATTTPDATAAAHTGTPSGTYRPVAGYTVITPPCEQSGVSCPGHAGGKTESVYYNGAGRVMERVELPDALGVQRHVQAQYSAQDQLLWTEDEDGNPTDNTYDPLDGQLLTTTAPDPGSGRPLTTYNYDETVFGTAGSGSYTPGAALQGVQAYYFTSPNWTSSTGGGAPDAVETDVSSGSFSFSWGATGPPALFSSGTNTNYSVRWVGEINLASQKTLGFETVSDGTVELFLDHQALITNSAGGTVASASTVIPAGKHRIVLLYSEAASSPSSNVALKWCDYSGSSCATGSSSFTTMLASDLSPGWENRTSTVSPSGKVSFQHFNQPWTGLPDYSLQYAPVNGTTSPLITSYSYDSEGRLVGKVLPNGNTSATIDSAGVLSGAGNAATSNWSTVYTWFPDSTFAAGNCTANAPSQLGLLRSVVQHGLYGTYTTYSAAGLPTTIQDAAGVSTNCYDSENRLISHYTANDTNSTLYSYDPAGRLLTASHAGDTDDTHGSVAYRYDEAGRLIDTIDPQGGEASYSYDANGNRTARTAFASVPAKLTLTGNEIADWNRNTGNQGDGRRNDSSYGIWQNSTNLISNGGFESNTTGWTAVSSTLTRTVTDWKFGAAAGQFVTNNSVANEGAYTTFVASGSAIHTGTAWVWGTSGATVRLRVADNTGTTITTGATATLSSVPQRITVVSSSLTSGTTYRLYLETDVKQAVTIKFDGVQAEKNPFATPYIQTNGATASRSGAGAALPTGSVSGTQGWAAFRLRPGFSSTDHTPYTGTSTQPRVFFVGNFTTPTSLLELYWEPVTHTWQLDRNNNGPYATSATQTFTAGTAQTVVAAWTSTQIGISVNGSAFTWTSDTTNPNLSSYSPQIGRRFDGGTTYSRWFDGDILWYAGGSGTLTNTNATTLYNYGDQDPNLSGLTFGTPTEFWAANTPYGYSPGTAAAGYSTSYTYGDADQLTSQTNNDASTTWSYYYDHRGNLRGIQYPNSTFSWTDLNPDGWTSDVYNRHGSITSTTTTAPADSTGSTLGDYVYSYTADGQKSQQQVTVGTGSTQTTQYTYDPIGRLQQTQPPSGTSCTAYYYDSDSNRTQTRTASNTGSCGTFATATSYSYTTGTKTPVDALTAVGSTSYTYNGGGTSLGDGQLISRGTDSLTWDGAIRLLTMTHGGNTACYVYSPDGSLETRTYETSATNCTTPTGTTNYLLGDLIETNASSTITGSYEDGPAGDLASYNGAPTSSSTASYLYYDGHGNEVNQATSSGSQTGTAQSYDPWGTAQAALPTNTTTHAYVGRWDKQTDTTTGLVLMGARPYDPALGRFLAVDPVDGGSLNNYDYAAQDPIDGYDLAGTILAAETSSGVLGPINKTVTHQGNVTITRTTLVGDDGSDSSVIWTKTQIVTTRYGRVVGSSTVNTFKYERDPRGTNWQGGPYFKPKWCDLAMFAATGGMGKAGKLYGAEPELPEFGDYYGCAPLAEPTVQT